MSSSVADMRALAAHVAEAFRAHRERIGRRALPDGFVQIEGLLLAWQAMSRQEDAPSSVPRDTDDAMKKLCTASEAGDLIGRSARTIHRWTRDGRLDACTVRGARRWRVGDVLALAEETRP